MSEGLLRYNEFRPTKFDSHIDVPEYENWYCVPGLRTRDSDARGESNFQAFLKALGGESDNVAVVRFGHWSCGWFEVILVNPEAEDTVEIARTLIERLKTDPILDREDFQAREDEEDEYAWKDWAARTFAKDLSLEFCQYYRSLWALAEVPYEVMRELWNDNSDGLTVKDYGCALKTVLENVTRSEVAALIRKYRI